MNKQDGLGIALEAVQQVLGFGLFDSPSMLEHRKRGRLGGPASEDELMLRGCAKITFLNQEGVIE